jgi:hypothetical protein
MPSWSASEPPTSEEAAPPPGTPTATAIERARRLLEQLFGGAREQPVEEPPGREAASSL